VLSSEMRYASPHRVRANARHQPTKRSEIDTGRGRVMRETTTSVPGTRTVSPKEPTENMRDSGDTASQPP
jgi:hypothetical protein